MLEYGINGAFAELAAIDIDAGNAGCCREGDDVGLLARHFGFGQAIISLAQGDDGAAFRGFIGKRGKQGHLGELLLGDAGNGHEGSCKAVAVGNRSGLVEEKRINIACRFHGTARGGDDIEADQPVHSGNANGRKQARRWWSG